MARHFHDEALRRADLTCDDLKEARMDWSPRQLLGAEGAIREAVLGAFKEDLAAAAALTAQMASTLTATDPLSLMKADPSDARFVG